MVFINQKIIDVLEIAEHMLELGDVGIENQLDDNCGILFSIMRDYAFNLRQIAEQELHNHQNQGAYDLDDETRYAKYLQSRKTQME